MRFPEGSSLLSVLQARRTPTVILATVDLLHTAHLDLPSPFDRP
jgi:hypothetical protein